jgi:PEP-CTERM motif
MFAFQNSSSHLKQLVAGAVGLCVVSLTAQAVVYQFTGQISFVGGAVIDSAVPGATTFTSFIGPLGTGDPVVQGGMETGAYATVPGGTDVAFAAPFTFSPAPISPFQLWTFTIGPTTYSFDVTSVTTDTQNMFPGGIAFLNVGGDGQAYITGYSATPATWSITGTSANSAAVTITIGSAINAVPEPSTASLIVAGLLICGVAFRQHLQRTSQLQRSVVKA